MIFEGQAVKVAVDDARVATVTLDLVGDSVNKFNSLTLSELASAVDALKHLDDLQGVIFASAKDVFVVGADITEFTSWFKMDEQELTDKLQDAHNIFSDIANLPCPTVAAINGIALGGGMELCLACDYRVMADSAKIGLPETQLGIYPGWGGTVRLPRLIGADNACEWICGGAQKRSEDALKDGAVDAVVPKAKVNDSARHLIQQVIEGKLNYHARRDELRAPMEFSPIEKMMIFESVRGVVGAKAGKHYPAPMAAIKTIEKGISQDIDKAIETEIKGFIKLAKGPVAKSLVNLFLSDQQIKKTASKYTKNATPDRKSVV